MHQIYSVGHSNHTFDKLISLLKEQNIQVLVDVRSSPYSKYSPHFNYEQVKGKMPSYGIEYHFKGKSLGGMPQDEQIYDEDGRVLYYKLAGKEDFLADIEWLRKLAQDNRVAIMCSEENPASCHRRLLLGRVLRKHDIQLSHIRGNGDVQTEHEICAQDSKCRCKQ
ncbi:DUF488 family protein [Elusimicrobiota bacterium]